MCEPLWELVRASRTSLFCLLVLPELQLGFPAVTSIRTGGSNWEFNNFLMFLVVFRRSTENEPYFSSMFPHSLRKLSVLKPHRGFSLPAPIRPANLEAISFLKGDACCFFYFLVLFLFCAIFPGHFRNEISTGRKPPESELRSDVRAVSCERRSWGSSRCLHFLLHCYLGKRFSNDTRSILTPKSLRVTGKTVT